MSISSSPTFMRSERDDGDDDRESSPSLSSDMDGKIRASRSSSLPDETDLLLREIGPATRAAASGMDNPPVGHLSPSHSFRLQRTYSPMDCPLDEIKEEEDEGPQDDEEEEGVVKPTPSLLISMPPERRQYIIRILRESIPLIARARREQLQKNAAYASLCILDAFQGRLSNGLANNSKKSKWIYTIFCIQTSDWMYNLVVFASVLHTFSIFFEPTQSCPASLFFKLYQWLVVLIYAVDIALKMGYEGVQEYFGHNWQVVYVGNMVCHLLDLCLCGCTCYANPLRPVAGVLRARKGRKFFEVLKKMLPGMMHSLAPIVFFVVVVMGLSSLSFDHFVEEFRSTAYTFYNWIFLIFTNDNYDRLLPAQLLLNMTYLLFFFPAIYVGQRFLLSLIIGDTYEIFRSYVKKQLKKEQLKEMQGLTKAFAALDDRKTGVINSNVFKECMLALQPNISEEAIALYFELLAGGSFNDVNVLQFIRLRQVLDFKIQVSRPNRYLGPTISYFNQMFHRRYDHIVIPVGDAASKWAHAILTFFASHDILDYINFFDIVILAFDIADEKLGMNFSLPFTLCHLVSFFYLFEFVLRVMRHNGVIVDVSKKNNFIAFLFVLGCMGTMFINAVDLLVYSRPDIAFLLPSLSDTSLSKLTMLFHLLRCLRMANLNDDLQDFTGAILDIVPALFETFIFTFIVTYIFGALGNILFGSYMEEWSTPLKAVVKTQELTFMVGYLSSMEAAMATVHPLAIVYFASYLILSLTVSNIALSMIIDLHGNVLDANSKKNREKQRQSVAQVFVKLIDQARIRGVVGKSNRPLNFQGVTMSEFQTSDVRHFVAKDGFEKGINLEDLKQCQKYASVDLVKLYNDQQRLLQKDMDSNWERDFLDSLMEFSKKALKIYQSDEVLYQEGQAADKVFILIEGTVILSRVVKPSAEGLLACKSTDTTAATTPLSRTDSSSTVNFSFARISPRFSRSMSSRIDAGVQQVPFHPTNLLGAEALQTGNKYGLTVIADSTAKVLVIEQREIITQLDSVTLGKMMKMAFKSSQAIETSFAEAPKKKRFSVQRTPSHSQL